MTAIDHSQGSEPSDTAPLTVGLLGCGTVGSGVVRLLTDHAEDIATRVGVPLKVGPVAVRNPSRDREVQVANLTTDAEAVVTDPDVDIVVEVMGGIEPTRGLIAAALQHGKPVISANKELIATLGGELISLANRQGLRLEYEAAVAGAIPIIRPLRASLAGDRVRRVMGILNGTTNYILTKMTAEGATFSDALGEAQHLGYAERDPSADIEGYDAAAKAAIIASLAFDAQVVAGDVYREGITQVTGTDIANAARLGYVIKLLGIAERTEAGIGVRVHPALVPNEHPLASVRESFNAVFVEAEGAGDLMFYGRGAGSLPTASAVVGDVVSVARGLRSGEHAVNGQDVVRANLSPFEETRTQYSVLLDVADEAGVLANVAAIFGTHNVSLRNVWQEGADDSAQLLLITHEATERNVQATLHDLRRLGSVRAVANVMRVEGGEP